MDRINVTRSFLPPIEEYNAYLKKVWASGQLTNQGPLLRDFESKLNRYLGVDNLQFVSNGTIALQISLKALEIDDGDIITTPFSYVATTSSILWQGCNPVYVDIDEDSLCINPSKIEEAITDKTRAIMAVHVFGNPCDVKSIEEIAKKYDLKVIYDAAHAFGVNYDGKSLLSYGDISTCSFHSTKLFHTIEGGAIIAKDDKVSDDISLIKKFGHYGDDHKMLGINAKASEFQAAMGLCNLKYIESNITNRKRVVDAYNSLLGDVIKRPTIRPKTEYNYAYYPIIFENEARLMKVIELLNIENIFPRRYFYPSLNKLPYINNNYECPVSEDISKRILCLPLYDGLDESVITKVCEIIKK